MGRMKLIGIVLLSFCCLIIILQNTVSVETRLLFITVAMPQAVLLLITTVVGFLVGVFVSAHYLKIRPSQAENDRC